KKICPNEFGSFTDWEWAQNTTNKIYGGSWFDVDENIINFIAAPKLSSEVEDYISNLDKNDPNYYFKMQTALAKFHFGNNYEDIIKSLNSNNDYCENTIHDKDVFIINKSIPITNWIVVVIMPKQEILEKANLSTATITKIMQESIKKMDGAILLINIVLIFVFIAIIICVILIAKKTTRKVTDPITQLNKDVRRIGSGILDYVSNIKTGDEIEMLSNTFENMTKSLRNYINDLNTITADKERIATELNVAKQIQASMLPCIFPPFPDKKEFDIYASMQPAKEVGGDFYDFFLVDKSHLGIIIADVSGKGVPAALFMVIAKTLIKNHAQSGISPAEVFTATNAQLCENNDATMFVTAWMGLIEINTGKVTYVNAGHNPPLIKKNNRFSYLKCKPGFILAGLQGFEYKQEELILDKGDQLFLYTDGVTESTNAQNQLFGDNRLLDILNLNLEKSVTQILPIVKNEIEVFIEDAPQFDDITMLCIEYKGLLK
ncbi:MAG: SpoIIE family protein phosphatase, partial [Clostridia bacterium]